MPKRVPLKLLPHERAHATGRWAEIIFRALSARVARRWRFVSFRGSDHGEWRGVVDVLAVRKDTSQPQLSSLKRGDLFEIVLVQMKGGSARVPSIEERRRLRLVARQYRAREIVLFSMAQRCVRTILHPRPQPRMETNHWCRGVRMTADRPMQRIRASGLRAPARAADGRR